MIEGRLRIKLRRLKGGKEEFMKKIAYLGASILTLFVILSVNGAVYAQSPTAKKQVRFLPTPAHLVNTSVTAISGNTLTVTKDSKPYTINTDANTKFRRRFWGKSSLSEISVGDELNIWGKWTDEGKTTISARLIRDLSIQKRQGVFIGQMQGKSDSGFTLQTKNRGVQTVTTDKKTKYYNRMGRLITVNDLNVNDTVKVRGLWDSKLNTITEVLYVKDFSIPVKPATPTPK